MVELQAVLQNENMHDFKFSHFVIPTFPHAASSGGVDLNTCIYNNIYRYWIPDYRCEIEAIMNDVAKVILVVDTTSSQGRI